MLFIVLDNLFRRSATMGTLETARCVLCGSDNPKLLFVGHDRLHHVPGEFNVVQCQECSLIYLNPRPAWNDMKKFYPSSYAPYILSSSSFLQRWIHRGGLRKKWHLVRKYKSCGALLDVGCATGDFLRMMSYDRNWKLFGLEPNLESAQQAAQIPGVNIFCGRLEDAIFPSGFFSVITMWHVLEHLYEPLSALGKLCQALKPDGVLIMAVPVLDSVDAKLFGPYWSGYDVPRHLVTYSKATLLEILSRSGFSLVRFESFIGGYDAFRISLNFWAEERLKRWSSLSKLVQVVSRSLMLRFLMMPYFWIINGLGRGSTAVVVARPAINSGRFYGQGID